MNKALTSLLIATLCFTAIDLPAHESKLDSLLRILEHTPAGTARVDALNKVAFSYASVTVRMAEDFAKEAIQQANDLNYTAGLAEGFKVLGIIYLARGHYDKSIEFSLQSLQYYIELNDKAGQSKVYNNIAIVYSELNEFDKAFDFTTKSLTLKRTLGDSIGVANSYLGLAEFYRSINDQKKAFTFASAALVIYLQRNDFTGSSHAYTQLAKVYAERDEHQEAEVNYVLAYQHAQRANAHFQLLLVCKDLGSFYLALNQPDAAYPYLHQALRMARERKSKNNEAAIHELLATYFTSQKKLDSALHYTQTALQLERDNFKEQQSIQVETLQLLMNFQHKEQQLNYQRKQIKRQYIAIIGVTLILILSIIFGIKLYRLNRSNIRANVVLKALNAEIKFMNDQLEDKVVARTEEIRMQSNQLTEYSFYTAHKMRGPLARILGLIELTRMNPEQQELAEILKRLEDSSNELDEVIRQINRKLEKSNKPTV